MACHHDQSVCIAVCVCVCVCVCPGVHKMESMHYNIHSVLCHKYDHSFITKMKQHYMCLTQLSHHHCLFTHGKVHIQHHSHTYTSTVLGCVQVRTKCTSADWGIQHTTSQEKRTEITSAACEPLFGHKPPMTPRDVHERDCPRVPRVSTPFSLQGVYPLPLPTLPPTGTYLLEW